MPDHARTAHLRPLSPRPAAADAHAAAVLTLFATTSDAAQAAIRHRKDQLSVSLVEADLAGGAFR